jgi:hypothetical protein
MGSRMNQGPRGSVKSGRFEALLDKLVAVQMDLEPVCGVGTARAQVVASLAAIADACSVLRSAIADVRNIIHQADGLMDLPEPVPALDQRRRFCSVPIEQLSGSPTAKTDALL